jgi:Xaa-Pro aminopeptidase
MLEIDEKVERLARLATAQGLGGILLNTQPNFSWLTGGRLNRIDGSRENGSGSLFVSADGRRFVVANNIEMPRLQDEALAGLDFTPCEYPWTDEQADPGTPIATAKRAIGVECSTGIGCDHGLPGGTLMNADVTAARALLTAAEASRYRVLGRDVGRVVGEVCRGLVPGLEELEIAQRVAAAVAGVGARAVVMLVAADERMGRYRHPAPTAARWRQSVMVVVCAQRDGLVAALSRIVVAGAVPETLETRTRATAGVFERLLAATEAGATGAHLFGVAAQAYADAGFAQEETRHHQGGATGYRSREWIAHPASREIVQAQQAFAWNPSITGTKIEETALLTPAGLEVLTSSPGWPSIPMCVRGQSLAAPGLLAL